MEKKKWTCLGILIVLVVIFLYLFRATESYKPPNPAVQSPKASGFGGQNEILSATPSAVRDSANGPEAERRQRRVAEAPEASRCGCVFDIDHTLTCGDPTSVIQMCKDNGCVLGLNTARNRPYADDVPLKEQGFPPNVLNGDDFVYNPNATHDNVVAVKVEGLRSFQHKWKINSPSKILFFDDSFSNIEGANAAGFRGVWCPRTDYQCGVGADQETLAANFFRQEIAEGSVTDRVVGGDLEGGRAADLRRGGPSNVRSSRRSVATY